MPLRLFSLLFFTLILSACSVSQVAKAKYQKNFAFSQLKTYRLMERDSKFSEFQNINHILRNNIELALEQQLDKQGLSYLAEETTDVIVSYYVIDGNFKQLTRYDKGVNFCRFCDSFYHSTSGQKKLPMQRGSLVVDLIDTKTKRSVWRSVYPLKAKVKDNSMQVKEKLDSAVSMMFDQFPKT